MCDFALLQKSGSQRTEHALSSLWLWYINNINSNVHHFTVSEKKTLLNKSGFPIFSTSVHSIEIGTPYSLTPKTTLDVQEKQEPHKVSSHAPTPPDVTKVTEHTKFSWFACTSQATFRGTLPPSFIYQEWTLCF